VITGASGGTITLTYTADGEKLTKVGTSTKQYKQIYRFIFCKLVSLFMGLKQI
jgi:hypothetical protein